MSLTTAPFCGMGRGGQTHSNLLYYCLNKPHTDICFLLESDATLKRPPLSCFPGYNNITLYIHTGWYIDFIFAYRIRKLIENTRWGVAKVDYAKRLRPLLSNKLLLPRAKGGRHHGTLHALFITQWCKELILSMTLNCILPQYSYIIR